MDLMNKPPQDVQIERMVLSSIINEKMCQNIAFALIKTSDIFFLQSHIIIFDVIKKLVGENMAISVPLIFTELKKNGKIDAIGGVQFLTDLSYNGSVGHEIDKYILILKEKWMRRILMEQSLKNYQQSANETIDVFELLELSQKQLNVIGSELSIKKSYTVQEILKDVLKDIQNAMNAGGLSGIPTGWNEWDRTLGGWKGNTLVVLAARPGMGKTAIALSIMSRVMAQRKHVLFFSLEMSCKQLVNRMVSTESNIQYSRLGNGRITPEEMAHINGSVDNLVTTFGIIDDTPAITISELRAKAVMQKNSVGLGMIIVDYMQLMKSHEKGANREQVISQISASLKTLSKELDVPVIALAQLSRDVEKRGGLKKPMLSDLRESGSIEQDADVVLFPWRPEYYKISSLDDGMPANNIIITEVAKNRGGACGDLMNYCNMGLNKVEDIGYIEISTTISTPQKSLNEHDFFTKWEESQDEKDAF